MALFVFSGIAILLATWDMSPSVKKVERILPDELFPK
jgi:hypothetical protein